MSGSRSRVALAGRPESHESELLRKLDDAVGSGVALYDLSPDAVRRIERTLPGVLGEPCYDCLVYSGEAVRDHLEHFCPEKLLDQLTDDDLCLRADDLWEGWHNACRWQLETVCEQRGLEVKYY